MSLRIFNSIAVAALVIGIFTSSLWFPDIDIWSELVKKVDVWLGFIFMAIAILTGLLSFSEQFMQHAVERGPLPNPWRQIILGGDVGIVLALVITNRPILAAIVFIAGFMTYGNLIRAYDAFKHQAKTAA